MTPTEHPKRAGQPHNPIFEPHTYDARSARWSRRPASSRRSGHHARCDSFVSLLSASGVALEDIARLVGHSGTAVTESVYRKQIRPVMEEGATAMNQIFPTAS